MTLAKLPPAEAEKVLRLASARLRMAALRPGWVPLPHQVPPTDPDWTYWLLISGRGSGKTAAGSAFVNDHALGPACIEGPVPHRIAIIAPTHPDAQQTCVLGDSGLLRRNNGIRYAPGSQKTAELVWANGAQSRLFGAYTPEDVERLRGPQHCLVWGEELAAWRYLADTWDMMELGLRLGTKPRVVVTTTPKPRPKLRQLMSSPDARLSRATTDDNPHLDAGVRSRLYAMFAGQRLGRQELGGEIIDDVEGALWSRSMIEYRLTPMIRKEQQNVPDLARVVVAVDPAITSGPDSDETGIVVVGLGHDRRGYVIADLSLRASPTDWAKRAIEALREYGGDRIVAESNQGGDMVRTTIAAVDPLAPISLVHASKGKRARAEPIAALYEQGRISHVEPFPQLEDQLCLAGDTSVTTDRGDVAIRHVRAGELVLTRAGWRTVLWSGQTGVKATVQVKTRDAILVCTGDHPVFANGRGFVPASGLLPGDELCRVDPSARFSNSTEPVTTWTATGTTRQAEAVAVGSTIALSGRSTTVRSPVGGTSTISITNEGTTRSRTSVLSRHPTTSARMASAEHSQRFGRFGPRVFEPSGPNGSRSRVGVPSAEMSSGHGDHELPIAPRGASSVIAIESGPALPVYNLTVHDQPEFYANGFLVHNCAYTGAPGEESPDRLDALVWGLSELFGVQLEGNVWGAGGKVWGA